MTPRHSVDGSDGFPGGELFSKPADAVNESRMSVGAVYAGAAAAGRMLIRGGSGGTQVRLVSCSIPLAQPAGT